MADDRYRPPRAPLKDEKERPTRPNLLAIIIGALTDVISTTIGGLILGVAFAVFEASNGVRAEDMATQLYDTGYFRIASAVLGLSCSVLGGYVCARFANQNEYANGLAVGVIGLMVGELLSSGAAAADPWLHILAIATIPAALLGAHLKLRRDKPVS